MFSKKIIAALVLIVICVFGLYAGTYTVIGYKYTVLGKTTEQAIDYLVNPHTEEKFDSLEALEAAVKRKGTALWNTNLFNVSSVNYSITSSVDEDYSVTIEVYVEDADSTIIFPYPKYDSNNGFVFGIRFKEKNLFGLMATMDISIDGVQQEKSFKYGDYKFSIPISGIKINDLKLSAELSGDIDLLNTETSFLKLVLDETGWKIGTAEITTSLNLLYYYGDKTKSAYVFKIAEKGLQAGPGKVNVGFEIDYKPTAKPVINKWALDVGYVDMALGSAKLSATYNGLYYPILPSPFVSSDSYHKFTFSVSDIKVGGFSVSETPVFTFQPAQNSMIASRFYSLDNTVTVAMPDGNITGKKLSNNVYWEIYRTKTSVEKYNYVKTNSSFSFNMLDDYTDSVIFKTWRNDDKNLYRFDFDFRVEKSFGFLNGKLNVSPIVTLYNTFIRNENKFKYSPYLELAFSAGLAGGEINRIDSGEDFFAFRDNFRHGIKYNLQLAGRFAFSFKPQLFLRGSITAFPLKNAFFNPSIRLLAMAKSGDSGLWFDKTSSSDPYKLNSQADSDYFYSYNSFTYNEFNFDKGGLGTLLRGILDESPAISSGGFPAKAVIAGNVNLTTALFNFEDMGHTYINPFYDFVMFIDKSKVNYLHSVGVEGIAILDSHPAYPFRFSLGFNADTLFAKLRGEDVRLEYEIFLGINWLY